MAFKSTATSIYCSNNKIQSCTLGHKSGKFWKFQERLRNQLKSLLLYLTRRKQVEFIGVSKSAEVSLFLKGVAVSHLQSSLKPQPSNSQGYTFCMWNTEKEMRRQCQLTVHNCGLTLTALPLPSLMASRIFQTPRNLFKILALQKFLPDPR